VYLYVKPKMIRLSSPGRLEGQVTRLVALGGIPVILAIGPKVCGLKPTEDDGFLSMNESVARRLSDGK
jgi:hypothetical protein